MVDSFIERRIVTGLIVSTDYTQQIRPIWSSKMLQSRMAQSLSNWCVDFFDEFHKAPGIEIESIFRRKRKKMGEEEREDIEDLLSTLSDDYEREDKFNVDYLLKQTIEYFEERELTDFVDSIKNQLEEGNITEAKTLVSEHKSVIVISDKDIDLASPEISGAVEKAFEVMKQPVVEFPRQLGEFWNSQLVRGAFVALMAPEKRGKTFWLLEFAMRAAKQRSNVAFFQAGDMDQSQQLLRMCVYLAKKNNKERYCGEHFEPIRDCKLNQLNKCSLKVRESDFGVFEDKDEKYLKTELTFDELVTQWEENPDYKPCWNCSSYWKRHKQYGSVWLKRVDKVNPLGVVEAQKVISDFFEKQNRRFKLSTHANKTLTVTEIERTLDLWERRDGFVPDLIVTDYIDIMASELRGEFRHQENDKWMRMRGLSQNRNALVISVTQTDAKSYEQNRLSLKNFSEDKRKFAHVTAMYGLNQDKKGREKEMGVMRINEIVVREDAFSSNNEVYVLQNLSRGIPFISSFW